MNTIPTTNSLKDISSDDSIMLYTLSDNDVLAVLNDIIKVMIGI